METMEDKQVYSNGQEPVAEEPTVTVTALEGQRAAWQRALEDAQGNHLETTQKLAELERNILLLQGAIAGVETILEQTKSLEG